MQLTDNEKIIIEMRANGAHIGDIILAIYPNWNGATTNEKNIITNITQKLLKRGLIERRKPGNTLKTARRGKDAPTKVEKIYTEAGKYRVKPKCKFPNCRKSHEKEFAKVPLCEGHFTKIWEETIYFYEGEDQREYKNRRLYLKIVDQIKHRYKGGGA